MRFFGLGRNSPPPVSRFNEPAPRNYAGPNAGELGSVPHGMTGGSMGHQSFRVNHDYSLNHNGQRGIPRG